MTHESGVRILEKLADHDEQLGFIREHMVTREEFHEELQKFATKEELFEVREDLSNDIHSLRSEMLQGQDEMITILKRLDQDRIFTIQRIERIEQKIGER